MTTQDRAALLDAIAAALTELGERLPSIEIGPPVLLVDRSPKGVVPGWSRTIRPLTQGEAAEQEADLVLELFGDASIRLRGCGSGVRLVAGSSPDGWVALYLAPIHQKASAIMEAMQANALFNMYEPLRADVLEGANRGGLLRVVFARQPGLRGESGWIGEEVWSMTAHLAARGNRWSFGQSFVLSK